MKKFFRIIMLALLFAALSMLFGCDEETISNPLPVKNIETGLATRELTYDTWLNIQMKTLDGVAAVIAELDDKKLIEEKLLEIHGVYFDYLSVGFSDDTILTCDGWTAPEEYRTTQRGWYKDAIKQNGGIAVSESYEDAATGDLMAAISKYIGKIGGVDAVILAEAVIPEDLRK
jgi:hypothetical protein